MKSITPRQYGKIKGTTTCIIGYKSKGHETNFCLRCLCQNPRITFDMSAPIRVAQKQLKCAVCGEILTEVYKRPKKGTMNIKLMKRVKVSDNPLTFIEIDANANSEEAKADWIVRCRMNDEMIRKYKSKIEKRELQKLREAATIRGGKVMQRTKFKN